MKKILLIILLFGTNLGAYYYLTEYVGINSTFEEIVKNFIAMMIFTPIGTFIPAYSIYYNRLATQRVYIPYKQIYLKTLLNIYIFGNCCLLLIAFLVLLKMKDIIQ